MPLRRIVFFLLLSSRAMGSDCDSLPKIIPHKTLTFATVEWQPFYGPDLPDGGPVAKLIHEVFLKWELAVSIEYMPWSRAMVESANGSFAGLVGAYDTPDRREKFTFSKTPVGDAKVVFVTTSNKIFEFKDIQDLESKGLVIGQLRGAAHTPEFEESAKLNKVMLNSTMQAVEMMLAGRVDTVRWS